MDLQALAGFILMRTLAIIDALARIWSPISPDERASADA